MNGVPPVIMDKDGGLWLLSVNSGRCIAATLFRSHVPNEPYALTATYDSIEEFFEINRHAQYVGDLVIDECHLERRPGTPISHVEIQP